MNSFDNLYVPDPYSGSILKPQVIWIVDPWTWPSRPYIGDNFNTWTGDKWPFDDTPTTAPNIPKVPYSDEEQRKSQYDKDYHNLFEKIKNAQKVRFGFEAPKSPWTNTLDGGSKFTLELAGTPKATVSVEINYDGKPNIVVKSKVPTVNIGGNWFIPSPERLDMEAAKLNMEDGLLEIFFPPKKVEKKSIKLL